MKMKRVLGGLLTAAVAFAFVVAPAQAASIKGLTGEFKFTTGEDPGWADANYEGQAPTDFSAADLTVSYDLYIPADAMNSILFTKDDKGGFGSSGNVNIWNDTEKKSYNIPMCGIDFNGTSKGKQIDYWHWDEAAQESYSEISYGSVTYSDGYYKLSIKDAPVDTGRSVNVWDDATGSDSEASLADVPANGSISFGADLHCWNLTKAYSGKFFLCNATVKSNGTVVFSNEDAAKINQGFINNNTLKDTKVVKLSTFNPTCGPAKTKVTVNTGKKTTLKVTTHFKSDKVTVKTNKKAIATATYKNGKLTIKGVKKGKAVLTLTIGKESKKINVTVK